MGLALENTGDGVRAVIRKEWTGETGKYGWGHDSDKKRDKSAVRNEITLCQIYENVLNWKAVGGFITDAAGCFSVYGSGCGKLLKFSIADSEDISDVFQQWSEWGNGQGEPYAAVRIWAGLQRNFPVLGGNIGRGQSASLPELLCRHLSQRKKCPWRQWVFRRDICAFRVSQNLYAVRGGKGHHPVPPVQRGYVYAVRLLCAESHYLWCADWRRGRQWMLCDRRAGLRGGFGAQSLY